MSSSVVVHLDQRVSPERSVDVYSPVVAGNNPVILVVHGGAFMFGTRGNTRDCCEALVTRGYVCVAAEYGLSHLLEHQSLNLLNVFGTLLLVMVLCCTTVLQMTFVLTILLFVVAFHAISVTCTPPAVVRHPSHVMDVAESLRWTYDHIAEYGGNPNNIHVLGHSAGGHLAALLATNQSYASLAGVPPGTIKSCVSISGLYSDKRLQETALGRQLLETAFGVRPHYYDAFPIYNVNERSPPFLLLNADLDISTKRHSFDFHYVLRQSGIYVETAYFGQLNHWSIMDDWLGKNQRVLDKIDSHLQEVGSHP
jgi:acetyl esterase/lipase